MGIFQAKFLMLLLSFYLAGSPDLLAQSPDSLFSTIELRDKSLFSGSPENWHIAGDVWFNPEKPGKAREESGTGILVSSEPSGRQDSLVTRMEHGDLYLELDFMLGPGAVAEIRLQNRYRIRLTASTEKAAPDAGTSGSLGGPATSLPPRVNASRAPGLWQHLCLLFRAPRSGTRGRKTTPAILEGAVLNGVIIHRQVALPDTSFKAGPAGSPEGPLVFSAGGPAALRNIRYRLLTGEAKETARLAQTFQDPASRAIVVRPGKHTTVQRCFMESGQKKRTYCAAIGSPEGIHYAMDLAQGNLLSAWQGEFYDASTMWISRGEEQIARPLGSQVMLSGKPAFAILQDPMASWPDSMQQHYTLKGYNLDEDGRPTFTYTFNGLTLTDKVVPRDESRGLNRTVQPQGNVPEHAWFRLAGASRIEEVGKNFYAVNDKSYYLRLHPGKRQRPTLRKTPGKDNELLLPLQEGQPIRYTILW